MTRLLLALVFLTGCESSRQALPMLGAMPYCLIACTATQTIVADNTTLTGGSNDPVTLTIPAVAVPLEDAVVGK